MADQELRASLSAVAADGAIPEAERAFYVQDLSGHQVLDAASPSPRPPTRSGEGSFPLFFPFVLLRPPRRNDRTSFF